MTSADGTDVFCLIKGDQMRLDTSSRSAHARESRRSSARALNGVVVRAQAKPSRAVPRRVLLATSLACASLLSSASATAAVGSARSLTPTYGLHAELVNNSAPPPAPLRAPNVRLRVPNTGTYATEKSNAERAYLARARRGFQTQDLATPRTSTAPFTTAQGANAALFEGLSGPGIEGGGPFTGVTPPDTTGAIGPNDYVEFVNSQVAVYNRSLTLQATTSEDAFTGESSTCDGQIRWDQQGERWEYASLACAAEPTEQNYMFGWSKTADPTNLSTGWCKFVVHTKEFLFDYPKLGGDNEYLMIGDNEFNMTTEAYAGSSIVVIPKPAPGESSCPSTLALTRFTGTPFTPVPANLYGGSSVGYAIAAGFPEPTGDAEELALFRLTQSAGKPKIEGRSVPVSSYSMPAAVPQPGTTDGLDSSDTRLTQAVATEDPARHEMAIWTQHTVAPSAGEPSVVRWYELTPASPGPVQQGTISASGGNFAFNGAISPTSAGNGAMIDYNVGGGSLTAELRAQSRGSATPLGTMREETTLAKSSAHDHDFSCPSSGILPSSSCRWGDYAGASPDPMHRGVVWGSGQVNGPLPGTEFEAQWQTKSFALTVHAPPTAAFSAKGPPATATIPVGFDGSGSSDQGGAIVSYEWAFGDGANGTGIKPSHAYGQAGVYTVKLTVTDDGGFSSSVEHTVNVVEAPPVGAVTPPVITTSSTTKPSNVVHVIAVKQNKKKGTVALSVSVPGAGVLSAREASSVHSSLLAPLAGALGAPAAYPVALAAGSKGKAKAKGPFVKSVSASVSAAGTVIVQIVPNAAGKAQLARKHRLAVEILITFTPTGGSQGTTGQPVTLVLSAGKKHK
jgi:hypothetical protein